MTILQEAIFWTVIFFAFGFLILQISKADADKK